MPQTNQNTNDPIDDLPEILSKDIRKPDEFRNARLVVARLLSKYRALTPMQVTGLAGLSDALRWACGEQGTNLAELIESEKLPMIHENN